jgi:hypothetical protein
MDKLRLATIRFSRKSKKYEFNLSTNMSDELLINAFESWYLRTKAYTAESFFSYVNDKYAGYECHTVSN